MLTFSPLNLIQSISDTIACSEIQRVNFPEYLRVKLQARSGGEKCVSFFVQYYTINGRYPRKVTSLDSK